MYEYMPIKIPPGYFRYPAFDPLLTPIELLGAVHILHHAYARSRRQCSSCMMHAHTRSAVLRRKVARIFIHAYLLRQEVLQPVDSSRLARRPQVVETLLLFLSQRLGFRQLGDLRLEEVFKLFSKPRWIAAGHWTFSQQVRMCM
jgi:hypothetical protein